MEFGRLVYHTPVILVMVLKIHKCPAPWIAFANNRSSILFVWQSLIRYLPFAYQNGCLYTSVSCSKSDLQQKENKLFGRLFLQEPFFLTPAHECYFFLQQKNQILFLNRRE